MRNWLTALCLLFLSPIYGSSEKPFAIGQFPRDTKLQNVSPLKLILNPEAYDGKQVLTDGYLSMPAEGFERTVLIYSFREDLTEGRRTHAFALVLSSKLREEQPLLADLNKKRVRIVGTFRQNTEKIMYGADGGAIVDAVWIAEAH